jgi:hypothetical protein
MRRFDRSQIGEPQVDRALKFCLGDQDRAPFN